MTQHILSNKLEKCIILYMWDIIKKYFKLSIVLTFLIKYIPKPDNIFSFLHTRLNTYSGKCVENARHNQVNKACVRVCIYFQHLLSS